MQSSHIVKSRGKEILKSPINTWGSHSLNSQTNESVIKPYICQLLQIFIGFLAKPISNSDLVKSTRLTPAERLPGRLIGYSGAF